MRIFLTLTVFLLLSSLFFVFFDVPYLSWELLLLVVSFLMLAGGFWCILAALLPEKKRSSSTSKRVKKFKEARVLLPSDKVEVSFDDFGLLPTGRVSGVVEQEEKHKRELDAVLKELKAVKEKLASCQVTFVSDGTSSLGAGSLDSTLLDQDFGEEFLSAIREKGKKHLSLKIKELPHATLFGSEPLEELHTLDAVDTPTPRKPKPANPLEMTRVDNSDSEADVSEEEWDLAATKALDYTEEEQNKLKEAFLKQGLSADSFLPLEKETATAELEIKQSVLSSRKPLEETMVV